MSTVLLEVVTPERVVLSREVDMVSLFSGGGELGILPRHSPLASTVKPGIIRVKLGDGEDYVAVSGGFVEVLPARVTILADTAETSETLDVDRAQRAKTRAESRLNQRSEDIDVLRAQAALERALRRLDVAERSQKSGSMLMQKG